MPTDFQLGPPGPDEATRGARAERNGIPLLPSRKAAVPVTLALVNRLRDEQP